MNSKADFICDLGYVNMKNWKEIEKIELRSKSLSISWVKHNSPIDIPFNFDNEQDIRVRMQTAVDALLRFNRGANNEAY